VEQIVKLESVLELLKRWVDVGQTLCGAKVDTAELHFNTTNREILLVVFAKAPDVASEQLTAISPGRAYAFFPSIEDLLHALKGKEDTHFFSPDEIQMTQRLSWHCLRTISKKETKMK
jgi:hypothetical protein